MKILALAALTALTFGLAAPAVANESAVAQDRIQLAQADVRVKVSGDRPAARRTVIVKRKAMNNRRVVIKQKAATRKVIIVKKPKVKKKIVIRG